MLIVMEHHRDAKEGKYGAGASVKCKSEPTDHHMLNGEEHIWFLLGFPNSILIHEFIHTIRLLLSLFLLPTLKEKTEIPGDTGLSHRTLRISCGGNIFPKEIVFLL